VSNQSALKLVAREEGDKQRALEAALAQIDRAFGKGSVMKLGDKATMEVDRKSTRLNSSHNSESRMPSSA
jgi:recombination protein RecA